MAESFNHPALNLKGDKKVVFAAMSKHLAYFKEHISKFVFNQGCVPLNPFMISHYFMIDTVDRDVIRSANNTLVKRADELWVFGKVSDGILAEIKQAKNTGKPIRYFKIIKSQNIEEIPKKDVEFEEDANSFSHEL